VYDPTHNGDERMMPGSGAQAPFSLKDVRQAILKRLWVVLLVVVVFVGTTLGFTLLQTPVYEASAKLVVGQNPGVTQDTNLAGDIEGLQQLTLSVVETINSRSVAEEVIQRLGLQMEPGTVLNNLTVEQVGSTVVIDLSYKDTDPQRAQQIVNTVGEVSSERIPEVIGSANDITVTVWENALAPSTPVSPDPVRNGILALLFGLMLGLGLALLAEYMDDSWRSPEEVEQITGVPTFGAVPEFRFIEDKSKKG
jgi:capsular polysaccharide biosynthesis protein